MKYFVLKLLMWVRGGQQEYILRKVCIIIIIIIVIVIINPLNAELNPICHFLTLSRAHHILHVSRIRVNFVIGPMLLSPQSNEMNW